MVTPVIVPLAKPFTVIASSYPPRLRSVLPVITVPAVS
jgi:hypothetical protein